MKDIVNSQLLDVLDFALNFVECCNEHSDDYIDEENSYRELYNKIKNENPQEFSKEEKEILIDACNNAKEELELSEMNFDDYYYFKMNKISNISNLIKESI